MIEHAKNAGSVPMVPKRGKTPGFTKVAPSKSQDTCPTDERILPTRRQPLPPCATPRATTTTFTGLKSYAAAVGNVPIIS